MARLEANEPVLVLEDIATLEGLIEDCHSSSNLYPSKGLFYMPIYKELLQLLPLFLISLHARCYHMHRHLDSVRWADTKFRHPYICTVLKTSQVRVNRTALDFGYHRLFIIGSGRPLLITESWTDGKFIDRHYYYGEMRWILYDRERLVPKRPSETETNPGEDGV